MSLDTLETFPGDSERVALGALGRDSLLYALGGFAYKGVALLTIPLLARILSPAQLGLLDLAAVVASLIGLVAVLGTDQAVAYEEPRSTAAGELWGSALALVGAIAAGAALVAVVGSGLIAVALTGDAANAGVVAAAGLYGAVVAMSVSTLNAVRLRGSPAAYAIASFILVMAEMSLALAVAVFGLGPVPLMVLGWAAGATIVVLPLAVRYLPRLRLPRPGTVRRLATFGGPLVPAVVAWLAADAWIRGALAREGDLGALGEYGIAYRIASVLGLVVTGFGVAWYPYLFRSAESQVSPRAAQVLGVLVLVLGAMGVVVTALAPEIIGLVAGPAYLGGRAVVAPLVGGMVALGAFVLLSAVAGSTGATRVVAYAALVGAGVQAASALLLVPGLGLPGAGLASLAGYAVGVAVLCWSERRILTDALRAAIAAGASGVAILTAALASDGPLAVRLIIGVVAGASLLVLAWRLDAGARARPRVA